MRVAIICVVLGSASAWAQSTLGCNKDTDCKGDRICVSGQCVAPPEAQPAQPMAPQVQPTSPQPQYAPPPPQPNYPPPPQQNYPPPQAYPPPPPQAYPPPPPPPYYPPPRRYYVAPPEYENPFLFGFSGMIAGSVAGDGTNGYGGLLFEGYAQLGFRLTPGFGIVGFGDLNGGPTGDGGIGQGILGVGLRFGHRNGITLGAGGSAINFNSYGNGNVTLGGGTLLAHVTLPFGPSAFGLHMQAAVSFYNGYTIAWAGLGFGWGR